MPLYVKGNTPQQALAAELAAGKEVIAEAIRSKGIDAQSSESLTALAQDISEIQQETYIINGGEMYAKQLYGALITPNYWNLYEVLAMLLSDGRLANYGGILLAGMNKGYTSIALANAGAGGAYVVSDKDANEQFVMYTEDVTHTWNEADDEKGDRWVAYCFANADYNFQITNTGTSPRSIFIGRHVGGVESLVAGRCSELVLAEGANLNNFKGDYTQAWGRVLVIRGVSHSSGNMLYGLNSNPTENVYIEINNWSGGSLYYATALDKLASFIAKIKTYTNGSLISTNGNQFCNAANIYVEFDNTATVTSRFISGLANPNCEITLKNINISVGNADGFIAVSVAFKKLRLITEESNGNLFYKTSRCQILFIGYITNEKTKSVVFRTSHSAVDIPDVELQDGWCKPLNVAYLTNTLTEPNMYAHILQRLKQDEAGCGDGVTITLGATNLAKLTSQESIDLLDLLTNTYGYTFA